jgi:hypothetical protein
MRNSSRVHNNRYGIGKESKGVITTKLEVEDLIKAVEDFCAAIDAKFSSSGKGT